MEYRLRKALFHFLSRPERIALRARTRSIQSLEDYWKRRYSRYISDLDAFVFQSLYLEDKADFAKVDFTQIVIEHAFSVMAEGLKTAAVEEEALRTTLPPTKLAKRKRVPAPRLPRSLRQLKELYDLWRKGKVIPLAFRKSAKDLKQAYIKRCQSVWEKHGEDFREGKVFSRDAVAEYFQSNGDMARSRASTIVQTESTRYYNEARVSYYDQSDDVTHYLFVAIRDKATTKWCRSRQMVVFTKGTVLFTKNRPPCHWNCRSEMLPLTMLNPRHRALIMDIARRAENRRLEPLPRGWNAV